MPSESREELIVQHVEAQLWKIKKADGYWHDVALVERGHPTPEQMDGAKAVQFSVAAGALATDPEGRRHGVKDIATLDVGIRGSFKATQSMNARERSIEVGRLVRDIIKCIYAGGLDLGGGANTSWISDVTRTIDTGMTGWIMCEVTVTVEFFMYWTDP